MPGPVSILNSVNEHNTKMASIRVKEENRWPRNQMESASKFNHGSLTLHRNINL